jgi:hypothetical protein
MTQVPPRRRKRPWSEPKAEGEREAAAPSKCKLNRRHGGAGVHSPVAREESFSPHNQQSSPRLHSASTTSNWPLTGTWRGALAIPRELLSPRQDEAANEAVREHVPRRRHDLLMPAAYLPAGIPRTAHGSTSSYTITRWRVQLFCRPIDRNETNYLLISN